MALSTGRVNGTARDRTAGADGARGPGRHQETGPLRRAMGRHWYAWAMVAPVILVTALLIGWPLARGVYLSLTDATEATIGPHDRCQRHPVDLRVRRARQLHLDPDQRPVLGEADLDGHLDRRRASSSTTASVSAWPCCSTAR